MSWTGAAWSDCRNLERAECQFNGAPDLRHGWSWPAAASRSHPTRPGIFHCFGNEAASRLDFARAVAVAFDGRPQPGRFSTDGPARAGVKRRCEDSRANTRGPEPHERRAGASPHERSGGIGCVPQGVGCVLRGRRDELMQALKLYADWAPRAEVPSPARKSERRAISANAHMVWKHPRIRAGCGTRAGTEPDEVRLEVAAVGICGSDMHMYEADADGYMIYPGYATAPNIPRPRVRRARGRGRKRSARPAHRRPCRSRGDSVVW